MAIRGALMAAGAGPFDDPDNYLPLAQSLAAGQGLGAQGPADRVPAAALPDAAAPIVKLAGNGPSRRSPFSTGARRGDGWHDRSCGSAVGPEPVARARRHMDCRH